MSTTTAPFFFISTVFFLLLFLPSRAASAQVHIEFGAGLAATGQMVRDQIATPILRTRFGNRVDESVTAKLKPAPDVRVGVTMPLRPGTDAVLSGSWSGTSLRVDEAAGSRDVQDVTVIEGILALRHTVGRTIELGGGFGAAYLNGTDEAVFRGGASVAPLVEAGAGAGWNIGPHRLHARAVGQLHRFDTNAISDAGGRSGNVLRYGVQASLTLHGATNGAVAK